MKLIPNINFENMPCSHLMTCFSYDIDACLSGLGVDNLVLLEGIVIHGLCYFKSSIKSIKFKTVSLFIAKT